MWSPPSLRDRVLCSRSSTPRCCCFWWDTNCHMQWRLVFVVTGARGGWTSTLSKGGWAVNHPILWRLHQPPLHVVAGCLALGPRHYHRLKRWLHDLSPVETAPSFCCSFKRWFEASFEKVSNNHLFSENRRKNV
jgi:hypothetical protein